MIDKLTIIQKVFKETKKKKRQNISCNYCQFFKNNWCGKHQVPIASHFASCDEFEENLAREVFGIKKH